MSMAVPLSSLELDSMHAYPSRPPKKTVIFCFFFGSPASSSKSLQRGLLAKPACNKSRSADAFFCLLPGLKVEAEGQLGAYSTYLLAADAMRRIANSPGVSVKKRKCAKRGDAQVFQGPMGAWCIWPRPQAESVATQTCQQMRARLPLGVLL